MRLTRDVEVVAEVADGVNLGAVRDIVDRQLHGRKQFPTVLNGPRKRCACPFDSASRS